MPETVEGKIRLSEVREVLKEVVIDVFYLLKITIDALCLLEDVGRDTLWVCSGGSMEVWSAGRLEARCRCADIEG